LVSEFKNTFRSKRTQISVEDRGAERMFGPKRERRERILENTT
jgi:hypothetical protein